MEGSTTFFKSISSYNKLVQLFLELASQSEENVFHFVDYISKDNMKAVMTSPKRGKMSFYISKSSELTLSMPKFNESVLRFIDSFDKKNIHLPKFVKTEMFNQLQGFPPLERFSVFLKNIDQILSAAKINFEVYLSDLSIDNIRKEYDEYKIKYFQEVGNVLSTITSKLLALPVATSAILYGITKLENNLVGISFLLLVSLSSYYYVCILLRLNIIDIGAMLISVQEGFKSLSKSDFFLKFPNELVVFATIKDKIINRSSTAKDLISVYFWIISAVTMLIVVMSLFYLNVSLFWIFAIGAVCTYMILMLRNYTLNGMNFFIFIDKHGK